MCSNCLEKLNKVYEFKKLCLQSYHLYKKLSEFNVNGVLNTQTNKSNNTKDSTTTAISEGILSNLSITPATVNETKCDKPSSKKMPNFVNTTISLVRSQNNTVKKSLKVSQKPQQNPNVILESKTEEMSIEIDPMDFDLCEEIMYPAKESDSGEEEMIEDEKHNGNSDEKDWEDEIEASEITKTNPNQLPDPILQTLLNKNMKETSTDNFQMQSGHFLSTDVINESACDICYKQFPDKLHVRYHKQFQHNNMNNSDIDHDLLENSLTLKDFTLNKSLCFDAELELDYECNDCKRVFTSAKRLNRHVEKYHSSLPSKKYFMKGSKNAKCDICDKEFCTQSYLQVHKKKHYRNGEFEPSKTNV